MNPDFRKVALIAAVLGLLVSVFFALRDDDATGAGRSPVSPARDAVPQISPQERAVFGQG